MFKFPSLPLSFFKNSTKSVRIQPELLALEERAVPAVVTAPAIRSIDGSGKTVPTTFVSPLQPMAMAFPALQVPTDQVPGLSVTVSTTSKAKVLSTTA